MNIGVGCHFFLQGILHSGIKATSPTLAGGFFTAEMAGASPVALVVKNLLANAGDIRDTSSIPALRRSPEEGSSNPLQYFFLENPKDRGAWSTTVHEWGHKESDTTEVTERKCTPGDTLWITHMSPDAMLFLRTSLFNTVATIPNGYLDLYLNNLILNKINI